MKYYSNFTSDKHLLESYDSLLEEKKVLEFWTKKRAFEKVRENRHSDSKGTFSLHCGPTFPTGSPHIGIILNSIVKDAFQRYAYQKKLQVVSQFGWDCHGLAVEYEVDKKLGIETPEGVQKMGVATYNEECRKFVQRHQAEWSEIFDRMGNWVDFSNTYSTMSTEYMEGVWRVFKQLYDKGLVYRDTKVLPYSTGCFTHLSNFEAEQNWKEVTEVSATISLNIVDSSEKLLIWTTAPWTLVANLAVCVHPNSKYVKVKLIASGNVYILARSRVPFVFTNSNEYVVLEEVEVKYLSNLQYHPLFAYANANTLQVLINECICDDLGTGILALSPYFGEDDYRVCLENGITFDEALCPIDDCGRFKQSISEVAGLSIKEASDVILETLQRLGHLVHREDIIHKKQHCWRSDVPLICKATSTWFIHVEDLTEKDSQMNWHHCKETMNLTHSRDWAIGRTRYWGTPLPIWASPDGDEIRCIGSIDELLQLTGGSSISDLHREFVDDLVIPSSIPGNPPLRRVPEVFDCWFESGTMPYIQQRNQADVIAEGADQTCGWFYTTSVLSAALAQPLPSKNIFAHGLVLTSDGSKVSKRKHNNADPIRMANKYGADALRLYLMTTPLVTGENFTLQEDGARKMSVNVIKPLYRIVFDLVPNFGKAGWVSYGIIDGVNYITNIFDRWMLSCTESVIQFYDVEMSSHRLHTVIPRIIKLLELVQEWYIPISHAKRGKGQRKDVTFILYNVVYKTCLMLAPFAPFVCQHIYQILEPFVGGYFRREFVHDCLLTERSNGLIRMSDELKVTRWRKVMELIREMRKNRIVPFQYRISELIVVHPEERYLEENELMDETMMQMANVHQIRRTTNRNAFGATLKVSLKADYLLNLGISRAEIEEITLKTEQFSDTEVEEAIHMGSLEVKQYKVSLDDIQVSYQFDKALEKNQVIVTKDDLFVVIQMNKDLDYYEEGTRMELINCVQKLRRKAKIFPSELVTVCYSTKDNCLRNAFQKYNADVSKSTNSVVKRLENVGTMGEEIVRETVDVKGESVTLCIFRGS